MSRVLVTGGSGFIGSHAVLQLLGAGYEVRTTVRGPKGEARLRALLKAQGVEPNGRLSFVVADLVEDSGWTEAVDGCEFVLHVASPYPNAIPEHEDDLIIPARNGALRVLRAARDAEVRRVVLTSSFAAIGYGHERRGEPFDETSWTNLDGPGVSPYAKSKTLAERAAWDFMDREGRGLELSVVNPVGVFGPVLGADYSTSIIIVRRLLDGEIPGCPQMRFGVVDVRDVVDLHMRAMTTPAANGERFLATSGAFMSIREIALTLKDRLGDVARRAPTREIPNWIVRMVALFDEEVRLIVPELGHHKDATNRKARTLLEWAPIEREDAIVATARSLVDLALLKKSP